MKKKYAISDNVHVNYLTSGKKYEIKSEDYESFTISSDDGIDDLLCLKTGCAHLNGGNWTIIEEEE